MLMRKLWNRPDLPVWSMVTKDETGHSNLNICTYVTSISMKPKRILVALYRGTKTLENIEKTQHGLLQLLSEELAPVVRVCGQQSGYAMNKLARLQKRYTFNEHAGLPYFETAAGYMELRFTQLIDVHGDHVLGVATVVKACNLHDVPILTTTYLKNNHYTR
jgi:flavin reductase (DIM6/NTAB) family NADH-FMN oxidoreductase RutF